MDTQTINTTHTVDMSEFVSGLAGQTVGVSGGQYWHRGCDGGWSQSADEWTEVVADYVEEDGTSVRVLECGVTCEVCGATATWEETDVEAPPEPDLADIERHIDPQIQAFIGSLTGRAA